LIVHTEADTEETTIEEGHETIMTAQVEQNSRSSKLVRLVARNEVDVEVSNVEVSNVEVSNVEFSNVEVTNVEVTNEEVTSVEVTREVLSAAVTQKEA
jgi:hypothetical protein